MTSDLSSALEVCIQTRRAIQIDVYLLTYLLADIHALWLILPFYDFAVFDLSPLTVSGISACGVSVFFDRAFLYKLK